MCLNKLCRRLAFACAVLLMLCCLLTVVAAWCGRMTRFEILLASMDEIDDLTQWMDIFPVRCGVTLFALTLAAAAVGLLPLCRGVRSRAGRILRGLGLRGSMLALFLVMVYYIARFMVRIITSLSAIRTWDMTILYGALIVGMVAVMIWWGQYTVHLRKTAEGVEAALQSGRPVYISVTFPIVTALVIAGLLLLSLLWTDGRMIGHAAALLGAAAHIALAGCLYMYQKHVREELHEENGSLSEKRLYLRDYNSKK